jgi:very-short-patch-repair endonuclease
MDRRIRDLLDTHGGLLTTALAGGVGLTRLELGRAVRDGDLVRIRQGAAVERSLWDALAPWEQLRVRGRAALLARPTALLSHHAALDARGLPVYSVDLQRVDVVDAVKKPFRRSGLVVWPRPDDLADPGPSGVRAVPVADAIVRVAVVSGFMSALVPLDAALQRGLVTPDAILARGPEPGHRGHRTVTRLLLHADAACESPGETRTRMLLLGLGLDVRSQVSLRLPGGSQARVDFLVAGKVVVEFDGIVKYDGADGRAALAAEKAREDGLRALGYEVVRLTWRDLDDPARVAGLIRAALARAAR